MSRWIRFFGKTGVVALLLYATLATASMLLTPAPVHSSGNNQGAVIRVYGADVWGVRGYFAIHTWIATRATSEDQFTLQEIIGWKLRRGTSALTTTEGNPNRAWFGRQPTLLFELTGPEAAELLPRVRKAVTSYPYQDTYTMWPGPNSNSFTQWVALEVPGLGLALPAKAIGKNWMLSNHPVVIR